MRTAIVTGATGFIGSRLVYQLLLQGWGVHALGRAAAGVSCADRVTTALDEIGEDPVKRSVLSGLHCHEVDLCVSGLGLPRPLAEEVPGGAILFHLAGDTRFTPSAPESQRTINVAGTLNVVRALQDLVASVVHVSTAYVAGNRTGVVLESDLDVGQSFQNDYEKSKLDAEIGVTDLCKTIGLPLCIVRPSIITNDMATGRSSALTHLNALVEVVSRIQKHYGIGDGDAVSDQIRMPIDSDCRPNLAPVDPIVNALAELGSNTQAIGKTFHLCHPAPQSNAEVVSLVSEAFGVKDQIDFVPVPVPPAQPTWTEKMLLRSLKPYLPYLNEACTFDLTNTRSLISDYDAQFGPITLDYLQKVIDFQRNQGHPDKTA